MLFSQHALKTTGTLSDTLLTNWPFGELQCHLTACCTNADLVTFAGFQCHLNISSSPYFPNTTRPPFPRCDMQIQLADIQCRYTVLKKFAIFITGHLFFHFVPIIDIQPFLILLTTSMSPKCHYQRDLGRLIPWTFIPWTFTDQDIIIFINQ